MPTDPNAPVILPLTRSQFWILVAGGFGTVITGYLGLIYVLVNIVYGGINERLKSLESTIHTAIPVLASAPR
jgi:hypothetical protein